MRTEKRRLTVPAEELVVASWKGNKKKRKMMMKKMEKHSEELQRFRGHI